MHARYTDNIILFRLEIILISLDLNVKSEMPEEQNGHFEGLDGIERLNPRAALKPSASARILK